jgi:hypothetical protein
VTAKPANTDADGGMKAFKSKKELVMLAGASIVFAFVIWQMYFSGDDRVEGPVEPEPVPARRPVAAPPSGGTAAPTPAAPAAAPEGTFTPEQVIEMVRADEAAETRADAPKELARDPFALSKEMREAVLAAKPTTQDPTVDPAVVVTLTVDNTSRVLAGIPGAEEAAKKGLKLQGCMLSGSLRAAVINGRTVMQGRKILGFFLESVGPEDAILRLGARRVRLVIPRVMLPVDGG